MLPTRFIMGVQWLPVLTFLHCLAKGKGTEYKCEMIKHRKCLGTTVEYNFTTLQLVTDSSNQQEIQSNLKKVGRIEISF